MGLSLLFAVAASAVLSAASVDASAALSRACVLGVDGHPVCARINDGATLGMDLAPVARFRSCPDGDEECWNLKGIEITNSIRSRRGGGGPLKSGPRPMLRNAIDWSKHQMGAGMQHQSPLPSLGCGIDVNRENVAMFGGMDVDPVEQCMKQWENSYGHLQNIIGAKDGDNVCVGIFKRGNEVYCTQTFSSPGQETPSCISLSAGPSAPRAPAPAAEAPAPAMEKPMKPKKQFKPRVISTQAPMTTIADAGPRRKKPVSPKPRQNQGRRVRKIRRWCRKFLRHYSHIPKYQWVTRLCKMYVNQQQTGNNSRPNAVSRGHGHGHGHGHRGSHGRRRRYGYYYHHK